MNIYTPTLNASQYDITAGEPTYAEGKVFWDATHHTLALMPEHNGPINQLGQEQWVIVKNSTGSQLDDGTVVYITGSGDGVPTVAKAKADAEATSHGIGLITHDIPNGEQGYVTVNGECHGLDTSEFNAGDVLYVSQTTAGGLTNTSPPVPNYSVAVGVVLTKSATEGVVLVIRGLSTIQYPYTKYNSSTGLIEGGTLTLNADTTKFDIASGFGYIVDANTTPSVPTVTKVSWATQTAQTVTNLATANGTYILINSSGVVVQQITPPTNAQFRTHIYIGKLAHSSRTAINNIVNQPENYGFDMGGKITDINKVLGIANISGNTYIYNDANLNINKSDGYTYRPASNFGTRTNPNILTDPAQTTVSFRYKYRAAGGTTWTNTGFVTAIDPEHYDDGDGTLGTVDNNKWTIQQICSFSGTNITHIYYGQVVYASKTEAINAVGVATVADPDTTANASLRCFLVVKQGATNLSDSAQAVFIAATKWGEPLTSTGQSTAVNHSSLLQLDYASAGHTGFLASDGTAADSSKLGGVLAAGWLLSGGTAVDSLSLGGVLAAGYATTGNLTTKQDTSLTALPKTDTYNVATADTGKLLTMNSSSDKIFNLPSVNASNIGVWYTFAKIGAGKVTIQAADSDIIMDSSAGGTVYCTTETYATITLILLSETQWSCSGGTGTWTTT